MRSFTTLAPLVVALVFACGPKPAPAPIDNTATGDGTGGDAYGGDAYGVYGGDAYGYGGDGYGGYGYGGSTEPVVYDPPLASAMAECDAYLRASEALLACDKFPADAKDGMRQGIDAIKQAQASGFPPEADAQIAEGCRMGTMALGDAAVSIGCPRP